MKYMQKTVNSAGLAEIRDFLAKNHKKGGSFSEEMLVAWAKTAEFQLSEGNSASIEVRAADSVHGYTQEFTISDAGLNVVEVELEDN